MLRVPGGAQPLEDRQGGQGQVSLAVGRRDPGGPAEQFGPQGGYPAGLAARQIVARDEVAGWPPEWRIPPGRGRRRPGCRPRTAGIRPGTAGRSAPRPLVDGRRGTSAGSMPGRATGRRGPSMPQTAPARRESRPRPAGWPDPTPRRAVGPVALRENVPTVHATRHRDRGRPVDGHGAMTCVAQSRCAGARPRPARGVEAGGGVHAGPVHQSEQVAPDPTGLRRDRPLYCVGGDRPVHCVAAALHDLDRGQRRQFVRGNRRRTEPASGANRYRMAHHSQVR